MMVYFKLKTGNDRNGNPRRIFVIGHISDSRIVKTEFIDEGYGGGSVNDKYPAAIYLGSYETTPKQYRDLIRKA